MTFETANNFGELRLKAIELARLYSGRNWNTNYEHDPGLTMLEILTNALALENKACDALMREEVFHVEARGPRWQEAAPGVFYYLPGARIPAPGDVAAVAVSRAEIVNAAESIPGVHRSRLMRERDGWALSVMFAPVAPSPRPFSFAPFGAATPATEKRRKSILGRVNDLLRQARPLCEEQVRPREMRCEFLELSVHLDLADDACRDSAAAFFMNTARDILLGRDEPLDNFTPSMLAGLLQASLRQEHACRGILGISGLTLNSIADRMETGENAEAGGVSPHPERGDTSAALCLKPGFDVFYPVEWHISTRARGDRRELDLDAIRRAACMADRLLLERLSAGQWEKHPEESPPEPGDLGIARRPCPASLHTQLPPVYGLTPETLDPGHEALESVRQMQGWLLFFEQLMAEALEPLRNAPSLFTPELITAASLCPEKRTPLWQALRSPVNSADSPENARLTPEELLTFNRERLRFLAALQGEKPLFENVRFLPEHCGPERLLELEAFRLSLLPLLNGVRLARRIPAHAPHGLHGSLNPLSLRLSLLLLPFSQCSLFPRALFEIRAHTNPACGHEEFRCCIHAEPANRAEAGPHTARLVVNQAARSLEEAEFQGLAALRLACLPRLYRACGRRLRVGHAAEVAELWVNGRLDASDGSLEDLAEENARWARSFLPPWVEVLEYAALGENRPFEIAVLAEAEPVPPECRSELAAAMRREIPAHLRAIVFFLDKGRREAVQDVFFRDLPDDTHAAEDCRYRELLGLLRELEAEGL